MSRKKRRDAVRVVNPDPFHDIIPYIMPNRTEAEVSMTETFDLTALKAYMQQKNAEGQNLKLFHAFCTAVARTIYHRPKMNIFIAGRRFWQRNDITLSFTAKQKFEDESFETLMFLKVKPEMTLSDISHIILGDLEKVRREGSNDLDDLMGFVTKLPRFILEILFAVLRKLEYHGIMPASLTAGDPNYSTVMLSNLGSIGCGAPYHHLSNYGTCSIMVTIGTMHDITVKDENGEEQTRTVVDATVTLDERIADGFYFAKSLRLIHYLFKHPELLEQPISTPLPDGICD